MRKRLDTSVSPAKSTGYLTIPKTTSSLPVRTRRRRSHPVDEFDPAAYLRERAQEVCASLVDSCIKGNATALGIYLRAIRVLTNDEPERDLKVTADDISRARTEATRRVAGTSDRVGSLQNEPPVLPDELCVDRGLE